MKKHLIILTFLFTAVASAQTLNPGSMTDTVGTLNQVSDPKGSMNQQDQAELQYQEIKQREKDQWEASKPENKKKKDK
jgi:hypothetical protein